MCCVISALLAAEEKRKQKEQLKILKQQVEASNITDAHQPAQHSLSEETLFTS